jgi:hypothetical protein
LNANSDQDLGPASKKKISNFFIYKSSIWKIKYNGVIGDGWLTGFEFRHISKNTKWAKKAKKWPTHSSLPKKYAKNYGFSFKASRGRLQSLNNCSHLVLPEVKL